MTQHQTMIAKWLKALGLLTAVSATEREEAVLKMAAYLSMLANRYPMQAFTRRSMEHVASRCPKGFPTYGELTDALSEWWKDNRPLALEAPQPPPEPPRQPPTEADLAAVRAAVMDATAHLKASELYKRSHGMKGEASGPKPLYLSPGVLDALNPLPNGYRRATGKGPPLNQQGGDHP